MQQFTVADIMSLSPCYTSERVTQLWAGRESLTAREIYALDIPILDRHWAILRLVTPSQELLDRWVGRAIDRVDRTTATNAWCDWADRWKSGEDRTAARAAEAARAARAAGAAEAAEAAWAAWAAEAAWAAGAARKTEPAIQIEELLAEHEAQ